MDLVVVVVALILAGVAACWVLLRIGFIPSDELTIIHANLTPFHEEDHLKKMTRSIKDKTSIIITDSNNMSASCQNYQTTLTSLEGRIDEMQRRLKHVASDTEGFEKSFEHARKIWSSHLEKPTSTLVWRLCAEYEQSMSSRTRHNVSRCRKMLDSFRQLSITLGRPDLQPPLEEELGLADLDRSERAPMQLAPTPSEMVRVGAQAIEDAQLRYQRSVEALSRVMQWSASRLLPALDQYRELPEGRELVARAFQEIGITNIDAATGKPCYLWEDDAG